MKTRNTSDPVEPAAMSAGVSQPDLSLIVSTIGRPSSLRRLLETVARGAVAGTNIQLILVDQGVTSATAEVLNEDWPFTRVYLRSERGLSRGRNVALPFATGRIIAFPDDDAWYQEGCLKRVVAAFDEEPGIDGLSGRQVTPEGHSSMLRFPRSARRITKRNVTRTAISSTLFFRADVVRKVGQFNEDLGVGSGTWLGSGEETDFVLRGLSGGARMRYEPRIEILQHDERPASDPEFLRKTLFYGCGQGHLVRSHGYGIHHATYVVARKVVQIAWLKASGRHGRAALSKVWTRGFIAGVRGVRPKVDT